MLRLAARAGRLRARWFDRLAARLRQRGRPAMAWTARLTVAAVASYVVAQLALSSTVPPLLAPLTALLVIQLTPVSILASGLDRVVSVVAGVGLAVLLSSVTGLTWWSLGLVIGISLLVGQVLRLGSNLLEVPISAMLVLGVGAAGAQSAAGDRIAETLVGAAVGVLSNVIFPPRVAAPDAGTAIESLAQDVAKLLEQAGAELASDRADDDEWLAERAAGWLGQARRLTHHIPNVGAVLLRAEESRRLNLRALGTPDAGPGLRQGLEALEHSAVAVRSLFGTFETVARHRADLAGGRGVDRAVDREADAASGGFAPQLREAFRLLLDELANGLRSFGRLVRQDSRPSDDPPDTDVLRAALEGMHEARARVTDLLLVDPRQDPSLAELNVVLLGTVERLLRELDLDERIRRQVRRQPPLRRTVPGRRLPRLVRPPRG